MKTELCAECVSCFEQLLSEPLGAGILAYVSQQSDPLPFMDNFFAVRQKLFKNKYQSPDLFLDDFNKAIEDILAIVGRVSDFAVCLSFFRDKVNSKIKPFLDGSKEKFNESLNVYKGQIKQIIQTIPNDQKSLEQYIKVKEQITGSLMVTRDQAIKPIEPKIPIHEQFDLQTMKSQIGLLLEDEDSLEVAQIIMNHQPEAKPNENGDIEIDLHKCSPYTLTILKNLLDKAPKATAPPVVVVDHEEKKSQKSAGTAKKTDSD